MFEKLQKNLGEALDFPADVMGDGPKVTLIGRNEIVIENFIEIVTFSDEDICIVTSAGPLNLTGKRFVLKTILPAELRIEGELDTLSYGGRSNI